MSKEKTDRPVVLVNPDDVDVMTGLEAQQAQLTRFKFRVGESGWDWLNRHLPDFLTELAVMATNPKVGDRTRLDCLKELISRPLPPRTVHVGAHLSGRVERMTDEEMKEYLLEELSGLD